MDFSVLMSVYHKEKPEFLTQCFNSIYTQTVLPTEIVLVKDGPLSKELEAVIAEFEAKEPKILKTVALEKNMGLGLALREGILHCRYELIARMDSDDICAPTRFEKQLKCFEEDKELAICGCNVLEFSDDISHIIAKRSVPLTNDEIYAYQKRRDAFNHPSVMYKKSAVLYAGNYQSCLLMEDTLLWVHMLMCHVKCMNLEEPLLYMRAGAGMFERRGGWEYFKKYRTGRQRVWQTGYIGAVDYFSTVAVQLAVALMPQKVRGFVFTKLLHR